MVMCVPELLASKSTPTCLLFFCFANLLQHKSSHKSSILNLAEIMKLMLYGFLHHYSVWIGTLSPSVPLKLLNSAKRNHAFSTQSSNQQTALPMLHTVSILLLWMELQNQLPAALAQHSFETVRPFQLFCISIFAVVIFFNEACPSIGISPYLHSTGLNCCSSTHANVFDHERFISSLAFTISVACLVLIRAFPSNSDWHSIATRT